ncbi:allophanate hydrolase [Chondrus crispus]|uniref:Allophanate hydrolase n=1 Tax=Chondrus crispus TaxID=2769 RepID=R7QDD2_CHOCR|nr:allophanate hydrolase [Chondrus crispus]CDF35451.1 allophanate hydrolase [Chondrus crispus]|eukprot:XP_005715270.1 allophanate hydrolase [Chondrus crispus]
MAAPLTLSTITSVTDLPALYESLHARASDTSSLFLSLTPLPSLLASLSALSTRDRSRSLPLHGVPYVLKDNIDLPPHPTTAACPSFAYTPSEPAFAAALLRRAGAVCLGKVNMDQFASGLVGTRTPHGPPVNPRAPAHIPGGSSSGSAVAVASALAAFALATDTAGSGRVPAAMNAIVGLKPTRGLVSTAGLVPAAKSLDCVAVFASCVADAAHVLRVLAKYDPANVFSRPPPPAFSLAAADHMPQEHAFSFGSLAKPDLTFDGDAASEHSYHAAVSVVRRIHGQQVTVDFAPFRDAAALLYGGPFVAERFAAVGRFIKDNREKKPEDFDPVVTDIVLKSEHIPAWTLFDGQERIKELVKLADEETWKNIDILVLPTIPRPVTVQEVRDDPVKVNSMLGTYTNFVNLMDYCAIAVPAPTIEGSSVPRGVTFVAKAFEESKILALAETYQKALFIKQPK